MVQIWQRTLNQAWQYEGTISDVSIDDITTNADEILNICKDIDTSKAACVQNLSGTLVKDALTSLIEQFVYLLNVSFRTNTFPTTWKLATVIPLYKGGNRHEVGNYRPVSLLPLPSKIIERVVHNRLYKHLEDLNLLDKNQGGFRKNQSTVNTISKLTGKIFDGINNRNMTIACFIDMAKAFDTVNHNILLQKLNKLGIRRNTRRWLENYLTNRKQCTMANGTTSSYHDIVCGVPQGSILGPLLFIIYMNDINTSCKNSNYLLYADDTVIFNTKDINVATRELQTDLDSFSIWCERNQLTMNVKKTKYVIFGMKSQTRGLNMHELYVQDQKLQKVATYKYLGMTLDMNLTFNNHLQQTINVICHKLLLLCKLRKYIDRHTAIILYKSMLLSIIEYGDVIYGGCKGKLIQKLQKIQNRILRICIYTNVYIQTDRLYTVCKTCKLGLRRDVHLNLFMYKQQDNIEIVNQRNVCTRAHDALLYVTNKPNNEKYKQNVYYRGALLWNSLPIIERNIPNFKQFKESQKRKLL